MVCPDTPRHLSGAGVYFSYSVAPTNKWPNEASRGPGVSPGKLGLQAAVLLLVQLHFSHLSLTLPLLSCAQEPTTAAHKAQRTIFLFLGEES